MAKNKRTPKQAMRYWSVGWNGVVIKARTARVAARKWLRDNAATCLLIMDHELDNPGGSGDMPHETAACKRWAANAEKRVAKLEVNDVPATEVSKGRMGPSAPRNGSFWSGLNR